MGANTVSDPPLFISYNGRQVVLKVCTKSRTKSQAANPIPNVGSMVYIISFFLVHCISLIEIGAHLPDDLPAIIRNKKRGGGGGGYCSKCHSMLQESKLCL